MFFQSFLGNLFVPVCEIDVVLNDAETRKPAEIKTEDGKVEKHFLFYDGESVSGKVNFYLKVTITVLILACKCIFEGKLKTAVRAEFSACVVIQRGNSFAMFFFNQSH